ncbi:MAG: hypothetical protein OEY23_20195, partial [Acidimicrobiia bacterium]|nr:hypothetical protein [Acidimicrobiia bacterium]
EALYDRFGMGFTLVRTDLALDVSALVAEAARRSVPLGVLDVDHPDVREVYERALTLVRPDLMVAWRADGAPADPQALWDRVTGWAG